MPQGGRKRVPVGHHVNVMLGGHKRAVCKSQGITSENLEEPSVLQFVALGFACLFR